MAEHPSDDKYICTLDAPSIKKAKEELNENETDRISAVRAFRKWLVEQPHIKWPAIDIDILLVFLRGAKFSQIRAREMLEGNLLMRNEAAHWFKNVDPMDPKLQKVLDTGFFFPLPKRDKEGRTIAIQRPGMIDPHYKTGYDRIDTMRVAMLVGIHGQKEEMTQVNGTVFMMDFTGLTAKHMANMMSNTDIQKWHKKWQKNNPGRFKKFIMYNAGGFFETMMTFSRPFLAKKYQERMIVCDTAESLYKHISMDLLPVEYLPDDYTGPHAGATKDLIANFKNEVSSPEMRNLIKYRTGDEFSIDESKRPKGEEVPTSHFRKLNVD